MRQLAIWIALAVALAAMPTAANAVTCYAKVGNACLKKSYGNLNSTCTEKCAVGLRRINGKIQLACLN
jgi:hypothetical protein